MKSTEQRVSKILSRGIIKNILPSESELKKKLLSGEQLRFYIGADPTGPSLHLSHAKNFMLLEEFRQLGHKVFVLFGDLTACIGDPTDRNAARTRLTREEAKKNVDSWVNQIKAIINFDDHDNPAEVVLNSTWFDQMSVTEMIELLSQTTVQRMLERDMFEKRINNNQPIFLHEFVYPLFQGYDSVALDVDVELCGTDQTFNALAGRDLLKRFKGKEKFVVAVNLMENPATGELMSKSNGTGVFLGTNPKTMFGEVMSLPDEMIEVVLINNTRVALDEIAQLDIKNKPRDAKLFTAEKLVSIFYGERAGKDEKESFIQTFSKKSFPSDAPKVEIEENQLDLLSLVKRCQPEKSNNEIRRLISQGAVSLNGNKITDFEESLVISQGMELKVGKRGFFHIN